MNFKKFLSLFLVLGTIIFFTSCSSVFKKDVDMALDSNASNSVIFVSLNYPPYYYLDSQKQVKGRCVAIVKRVCERLNLKPVFKLLPWKECLERGEKGMVDGVLCLSKTRMREYYYHYPRANLDFAEYTIFQNSINTGSITSLSDLKGKKVGVIDGIAYPEDFVNYEDCEKVLLSSPTEAMRMLATGKIDCTIEILDVGSKILEYLRESDPNLDIDDVKPTSLVFRIDPIYIGIPKEAINSEELFRKIDRELLRMQHSGEIFRILSEFEEEG
ncbi:MAG: hypothetical protein CR982_03555 [Candidatus Cloacimonadota bacterium]|nr:MAG: hypothetical protein CR982_03555 [Candidatus Cloacimonadota bacterium]PIE78312.1 MAG: hypothetical protein CSA15_08450 [Candidatus Delongbacteria bacterium]